MDVQLVSLTKPVIKGIEKEEDLIAYCARVSNPGNQMNTETAPKLLKYLIKNKHWSPFEMASMCVSIETSRAMAQQILRHRSFSFQEFSQRYSEVDGSWQEPVEFRYKNNTNRQSSSAIVTDKELYDSEDWLAEECYTFYNYLLEQGVAPETARFVLPLSTKTKIYMNGTIRSWIHYLAIRADEHTQKEHREIAYKIKDILKQQFPTVWEAIQDV
jgi:thymidylate synthase (FAD)